MLQTSLSRFGRLLLVIPLLRMVKATLVETLFFRETVGETNIKNIILGTITNFKNIMRSFPNSFF